MTLHHTIVLVTETSSKMALLFAKNGLSVFVKNFIYCRIITYQLMYSQ